MGVMKTYLIISCFILMSQMKAQKNIYFYGKVSDNITNKGIEGVIVFIQNSTYKTVANKNGNFSILIPNKKRISVLFKHLGYTSFVKEIDINENQDSVFVNINLTQAEYLYDSITITSYLKPDTLVGSPKFSIYDFDFYQDKFILLTSSKKLDNAELKLANVNGDILTSYKVPKEGGLAKEFYHDYIGYTNLVCENFIYRINIYHDKFVLIPLDIKDVNSLIKPIIDTLNGKIIYTDYWDEYPLFNYFSFNESDSIRKQIISIEDKELLHAYNFEYYSLPPKAKLQARRLADDFNTDKRIIASLMTGFTKSMFYTPLFAPLYIIKDTVCVFDHYKNLLFHFDKNMHKIDSISINYNHPKNWKEWKNVMLKDDIENNIFAVYDKNGHKYIKEISEISGKEKGKYTLKFHSAEKLKIHNGYAYYIYRPFESTQEKFFYRELIKFEDRN
jgi:hypothetical protein